MNLYEKNLNELKTKFPEVYEWITHEEGGDPNLELIHTQSGIPNLRVKGIQGRSLPIYDMEDPLEEEKQVVKEGGFKPDRVTFLIGIGLGYFLEVLKEKIEKGHRVLVIEKNPTMIKLALSQVDMAELIQDGSLIFTLPDEENLKFAIVKCASNLSPRDVIISCNKRLVAVRPDYHALREMVFKYIGFAIVGNTTALNNGPTFVENELANFPKFLFSSGVRNLHNRFSKIPGIIVSAGPSLEKNVHLLKKAQGKALIVATAPVVRVLLAHEIHPDLVVSIDFAKENRAHFEGLCDRFDIPLVYPIRLTHKIVNDFQGDLFTIQDFGGLTRHLKQNWKFKGHFMGGGSVAIYALMAALFCGCDPVIFVGQDLAFTNTSHVPGVHLAEKIDFQRNPQNYVWVDGIYGEKVPTTQSFVTFQISIEQIISNFERTFINSTEGGVNLQGTKIMPLRECLKEYCGEPHDISRLIQEANVVEEVNFKGVVQVLEKIIQQMRLVRVLCGKGLRSNKRIQKRLGRDLIQDCNSDRAVMENYHESKIVQSFCESFAPLSTFLTKETFRINRQEFKYEEAEYSLRKDLGIGLKRNRLILTAAKGAIRSVHDKLTHLLRIMKKIEAKRAMVQENPSDASAHYRYGRVLAEVGLHRLAVEEFQKAQELRMDTFAVHFKLGHSSLRLGRLKQAKSYFQAAAERTPKKEVAQLGIDAVEEELHRWRGKARKYFDEGNWVNALLYARKVLREEEDCPEAKEIERNALGLLDEKVAGIEEANEKERSQREKKKKYEDLMAKIKESFKEKNFPWAVKAGEEALELAEDPAEAESLLACCHSEMGNIDETERLFQGLCERFPQYGLFHVNLGRAFIRNGLLQRAAEEFEKAYSKEKRYYNVLFEAAVVYMQFKEFDKAIKCFDAYYERSPDSFEILGKIGTCYLAKGMITKARSKYEEALRIKPDYEPALTGLTKIAEMEQRQQRWKGDRALTATGLEG